MAEQITPPVFAIATDITSSLGMGADAHWEAVSQGVQGFSAYENNGQNYYASRLSDSQWKTITTAVDGKDLTPFETLCLYSVARALEKAPQINLSETVLVLSTTKGNIDRLKSLAT